MVRKDGNIENLGLHNMVLDTFSSKLLKRSSCTDCKFTGFHRMSDCTIGDFWGDQRFKEQHAEGLSVLMKHRERINNLLEESAIGLKEVAWAEVIANNRNIYWTHYPMVRHFPSRKIALKAMRDGDWENAKKQMAIWSLPGLVLRLYLKANTFQRKICCDNKQHIR